MHICINTWFLSTSTLNFQQVLIRLIVFDVLVYDEPLGLLSNLFVSSNHGSEFGQIERKNITLLTHTQRREINLRKTLHRTTHSKTNSRVGKSRVCLTLK